MLIEAGKYYKTRDGRKIGPMVWKPVPEWNTKGYFDGNIEGGGYFGGVYPDGLANVGVEGCTDLVSLWVEPSKSPVKTVTRKEIVPGTYGKLKITGSLSDCVEVGFDQHVTGTTVLTASDLRAVASTLIELADALDQ